jgi:hypothetical protein
MSLDGPPEVHSHHDHKREGGRRGPPPWLEWATSISALVVSVSSIFIAVHHGDTMDKLVKANSYPYVFSGFSDATIDGKDRISIDLTNNGIGPANEQSLKVQYRDRYVTSVPELVRAVLGPAASDDVVKTLRAYKNGAHTRFIAAKDTQFVFRIDKTPENARYWDLLDEGMGDNRRNLHIEVCYCSVFDECWAVHDEVHQPVKQCKRDEPHEFLP